jgi:hypothetical protein
MGMIRRHHLAGAAAERHTLQIGQLTNVKIAHLADATARHV